MALAPVIEPPRSRAARSSNFELNAWLFMRGSGLLLVCRDARIEVRDVDGASADHTIEIALATPDLEKLAAGKSRTAMAIADGRATYDGPVRQFLRVLPLVQAMVNPPDAMGTNAEDIAQEIV